MKQEQDESVIFHSISTPVHWEVENIEANMKFKFSEVMSSEGWGIMYTTIVMYILQCIYT